MLVQEMSMDMVFAQVLFSDLMSGDSDVTLAKNTLSVAVVRTLARFGS